MANLGHILAIPGTENVIEHLSKSFNRSHFLKLFFADYTVDFILTSLQEKIKKSQALREKITDWLREQVRDWQPMQQPEPVEQLVAEAAPILAQNQITNDFPLFMSFSHLQRLIAHLKQQQVAFPDVNQDSAEFLAELFALDVTQQWCAAHLPQDPRHENLMAQMKIIRLKEDIKSLFSNEQLGPELMAKVKEVIVGDGHLPFESFSQRLLTLQKVSKICSLTKLRSETALRIVEGKKELAEALRDVREQNRRNAFLDSLNLESVARDGLSPEMLEWILVSQQILIAQGQG